MEVALGGFFFASSVASCASHQEKHQELQQGTLAGS